MEVIKPGTKIDFVGLRHYFVVGSIAANVIALFLFFVWPGPEWGIDFAGGAAIQVSFNQPIDMNKLRTSMESLGLGEVQIQRSESIGGQKGDNYLLKVQRLGLENKVISEKPEETGPAPGATAKGPAPAPGATAGADKTPSAPAPQPGTTAAPAPGATAAAPAAGESVAAQKAKEKKNAQTLNPVEIKLNEVFGAGSYEILSTDFVGPRVGKDLRNRGFMSVSMAILMLLVYVSLRFEFRFGVGAVVALIHDSIITIGALILTHRDFNLTTIAALLTIVGYSVNDTIVVCDRIRENIRRMKRVTFHELINASINETLSRTILTSFVTFIAVFFLFILAGGVVHDFAFAMLVGIFVGTYSSVFIATPIVIYWEDYRARRRTGAPVGATK
jgi:preprotein translocase subunit SecF